MKGRKPRYVWLYYVATVVFLALGLLCVILGDWSAAVAWFAMATSWDTARYVRTTSGQPSPR